MTTIPTKPSNEAMDAANALIVDSTYSGITLHWLAQSLQDYGVEQRRAGRLEAFEEAAKDCESYGIVTHNWYFASGCAQRIRTHAKQERERER